MLVCCQGLHLQESRDYWIPFNAWSVLMAIDYRVWVKFFRVDSWWIKPPQGASNPTVALIPTRINTITYFWYSWVLWGCKQWPQEGSKLRPCGVWHLNCAAKLGLQKYFSIALIRIVKPPLFSTKLWYYHLPRLDSCFSLASSDVEGSTIYIFSVTSGIWFPYPWPWKLGH